MRLALTPGFRVRNGRIPSAVAAGKLEVEPLFKVPRLVSGLQPDGGWDGFERAVPRDEPFVLGLRQNDEAVALRPDIAMGLTDRAPQRGDGWKWANEHWQASSRETRRWSPEPLERILRSPPLLKSPISTTAPSLRHTLRTKRNNAMHTDRLLAHSLFFFFVRRFAPARCASLTIDCDDRRAQKLRVDACTVLCNLKPCTRHSCQKSHLASVPIHRYFTTMPNPFRAAPSSTAKCLRRQTHIIHQNSQAYNLPELQSAKSK